MGELKPLHWIGDTLDRVRRFSAEARADIGYQLQLVQSGEMPTDFRPMPDVGPGVMEIRVHAGSEYRVFYVVRFEEAIYVLHCFQKKTQRRETRTSSLAGGAIVPRWKGENMKATKDKGNVFSDLGFSSAEARNLQMRSQLMTALRKFVEKEGLTQGEAARRLKVTQPRVSDLMRGKISRFSLDTLVTMSGDAGLEVDLRITAKPVSRRVA